LKTDSYFITHFDDKGEKTFFTSSVFVVGNLKLMDMQEVPTKERTVRPHLLMKVNRSRMRGMSFGAAPHMDKKVAALGGGPLISYKELALQAPRSRYFLDHPDFVSIEKSFDGQGKLTGLNLTASPKELREFFKTHGMDKGLWVEEENAFKLEAKLNPDD